MRLKAYAKLNLALQIVGQYENGMHELDMLMQTVSLADELEILAAEKTIISCKEMPVDENNTAWMAARLFFEKTGIETGASITLEKNIPSQAGLGGGSSDAAAVLHGLNRLYGTELTKEELKEIGVRIGADVPFFIEGGCMRARGVGQILTPVENRCRFRHLLVKPDGSVPTGLAYRTYHELPKTLMDVDKITQSLEAGDAAAYFGAAENALMPAGIRICPEVETIIKECRRQGAEFAMMTGSGSCVFAVFEKETDLQAAQKKLAVNYPFCVVAEQADCASAVL